MTTEDLIETFIEVAVTSYKKNCKNSPEGLRLSRHQPVEIDGYTFTYWREYAVYKMGIYIKENIPNADIDIELNGNDSALNIELSDEEQAKLNNLIYVFLKNNKLIA